MATLLIAEPCPMTLAAQRRLLEDRGYRVLVAEDGEQARHTIATDTIDAALLSAIMPKVSGFVLCREIRGSARLSEARVVITLDTERSGDRAWSLRQGADELWVKPLTDDDLIAGLQRLLPAAS